MTIYICLHGVIIKIIIIRFYLGRHPSPPRHRGEKQQLHENHDNGLCDQVEMDLIGRMLLCGAGTEVVYDCGSEKVLESEDVGYEE